jgi:RNA polymerase sigma factor (sigma-70 family)
MENLRELALLNSDGQPLDTHISDVLGRLIPRLRREFPALQDDLAATQVMEEAGRRISARETRIGPIERMHGYAWVTVRSVATSYMRRGSTRLIQKTLESEASRDAIASIQADHGSADQIERAILLREALDTLSEDERLVCLWKKAGFSALEIAGFQGRSVVAVDTLFSRAKQKIRHALGLADEPSASAAGINTRRGTLGEPHDISNEATGTRDGRVRSDAERRRTIRG